MQEALTFADAGSVRLCTWGFDLFVPNGMGDGPTRVYVGDNPPVPAGANYLFMFDVRQECHVALYDCERQPCLDVPIGAYQAYNHVGAVYLVRIRDLEPDATPTTGDPNAREEAPEHRVPPPAHQGH